MKFESQIRSHPFLSLIPRFTLRRLMGNAPVSEYPKGTVIYRQDTPCEAIYLVLSGRCESYRCTTAGACDVEEVLGPGDTLGDRELLRGEPYRSTVTVATDCVLVRLVAADLRAAFSKNPAFAGRLSQSLNGRLQAMRDARARAAARVRRVVSLLSLAPEIDDGAVAERLATELHRLGVHEVLLVRLVPVGANGGATRWKSVPVSFATEFSFAEELTRHEAGFAELPLSVSLDTETLAPLISHLGRHFDFVILHAHRELRVAVTMECAVQSDWTYALLAPRADSLYNYKLLAREVTAQAGGAAVKLKPLVYAADDDVSEDFAARLRESGAVPLAWVRGFPHTSQAETSGGNYAWHVRSLAREIAGCRVGLALSSGGAKGLCHIGVLQVLEENGVEIDMVAGTSMGAYVGAVWASGHDGAACEKFARDVPEGRLGLLALLQPEIPPRRGFLKTHRVAERLRRTVGDVCFSELPVPLRVIATYLDTMERAVFSTGDVVAAVEASIAIPGVCVPVELDGEMFIDGGIVDPLPVDVLHDAGIERVIAVNSIPTPERQRQCLEVAQSTPGGAHPNEPGPLGRHLNYFARGNVLDTMFRSISGAQTRLAEAACLRADVVLRPVACDGSWHDFGHPEKYIALGRKVAEDQIEEILALVARRKEEPHDEPDKTAGAALAA